VFCWEKIVEVWANYPSYPQKFACSYTSDRQDSMVSLPQQSRFFWCRTHKRT